MQAYTKRVKHNALLLGLIAGLLGSLALVRDGTNGLDGSHNRRRGLLTTLVILQGFRNVAEKVSLCMCDFTELLKGNGHDRRGGGIERFRHQRSVWWANT